MSRFEPDLKAHWRPQAGHYDCSTGAFPKSANQPGSKIVPLIGLEYHRQIMQKGVDKERDILHNGFGSQVFGFRKK